MRYRSACLSSSPMMSTVEEVPSPVMSSWATAVRAIITAVGFWICISFSSTLPSCDDVRLVGGWASEVSARSGGSGRQFGKKKSDVRLTVAGQSEKWRGVGVRSARDRGSGAMRSSCPGLISALTLVSLRSAEKRGTGRAGARGKARSARRREVASGRQISGSGRGLKVGHAYRSDRGTIARGGARSRRVDAADETGRIVRVAHLPLRRRAS